MEIRELGPRVRCIVGLAVVIYDTDKKGVGTRSDSTWICFVFYADCSCKVLCLISFFHSLSFIGFVCKSFECFIA